MTCQAIGQPFPGLFANESVTFMIEYFRDTDKLWCESHSAPHDDTEQADIEEVWKAYLAYLNLAYPEITYRLVKTVTLTRTEVINA